MTAKRSPGQRGCSDEDHAEDRGARDWRGETLAWVRQLIHDADPEIQEDWKWEKPSSPGTRVWSYDGDVCVGESYKQVVKLTFSGAPPSRTRRSCSTPVSRTHAEPSTCAGDTLDEAAFKRLIRSAVAANAVARKK